MSAASIAALCFTVTLLVTHGYFLLGSIPLLVLKHDTPMDARFVRAFFDLYYRASAATAGATAASLALSGRWVLAGAAVGLALLAVTLRRTALPAMDALRTRFGACEAEFAAAFRRHHLACIVACLVQLAIVVGTLIAASMHARAGA